jgi:bla regulator protein blaR1
VFIAALVALLGLNEPLSRAQDQASTGPQRFEAASIKLHGSAPGVGETLARPGPYITLTNVSARQLIEKAYFPYNSGWSPSMNFLLAGDDAKWTQSEHFDVEATADGNPTVPQKQAMLRAMLGDRFKLAVHHETRDLPVFVLLLAKPGKTGPKLLPHAANSCIDPAQSAEPTDATKATMICGMLQVRNPRDAPGNFEVFAYNMTMPWLAQNLSFMVRRLIVDRTGLTGTFDVDLTYTPGPGEPGGQPNPEAPSNPSAAPSIFTALQEQLGLKLEPQTAPVDVLVIDHIEEPSPN